MQNEMNAKLKLYVIYGGKSAEHEVSLVTGLNVMNRLDKSKYDVYPVYITRHGQWRCAQRLKKEIASTDDMVYSQVAGTPAETLGDWLLDHMSSPEPAVVFPVIHGPNGEDGTLQGLLELLGVAYVGNPVLSSAVGMDKVAMKGLLAGAGILQAEYASFLRHEWEVSQNACLAEIERIISYPCYVKPANLGSSVGVNRCADRRETKLAIEHAFKFDRKIIVEREVVGREVQYAVMGNDEPICSVGGEFIREPDFFDYEKKYMRGNLVQRIPALIAGDVDARLRELALAAYRALDGCGLMRVDFFVTEDGTLYLNEVNTLPGFTPISMFPALWGKTDGTTYSQLLDRLIALAMERHVSKQAIRYGRDEA